MSNIDMAPAVLYIGTKDGKLLTLGPVQNLEYVHGPYYELTGLESPFLVSHPAEADFEVVMTRRQLEYFAAKVMGVGRIVYEVCGNRVCYLAVHHKKARVRKKNIHRACRMITKGARKVDPQV